MKREYNLVRQIYALAHDKDIIREQFAYYTCETRMKHSVQVKHDRDVIRSFGFEVIGSFSDYLESMMMQSMEKMPAERAFEYVFGSIMDWCNIFVFRADKDGSISPLIMREIELARYRHMPIFELPYINNDRIRVNEFFNDEQIILGNEGS